MAFVHSTNEVIACDIPAAAEGNRLSRIAISFSSWCRERLKWVGRSIQICYSYGSNRPEAEVGIRTQRIEMGKNIWMLLALIALLQSVSWADNSSVCKPRSNQSELNACAHAEFVKADQELNDAYRSVLKRMADDPLFVKNLRSAQRAWVAFRDAELEARFSCPEDDVRRSWGSIYPMLGSARKRELTKERTKQLRQILKDGPGQ